MEIKTQRKIVIAHDYNTAKDYGLRDCNISVRSVTDHTIDVRVIKRLPDLDCNWEQRRQDNEELQR